MGGRTLYREPEVCPIFFLTRKLACPHLVGAVRLAAGILAAVSAGRTSCPVSKGVVRTRVLTPVGLVVLPQVLGLGELDLTHLAHVGLGGVVDGPQMSDQVVDAGHLEGAVGLGAGETLLGDIVQLDVSEVKKIILKKKKT